ncbi:MAG: C-terminal helicase domain-containing protein, partial [Bacteroidales bacterium]
EPRATPAGSSCNAVSSDSPASTRSRYSALSLIIRMGRPPWARWARGETPRPPAAGRSAEKKTRILVATDVMSRGIDVKEINLVINFDVPHDAEDYVHRVGRTARINTTGEAITLVTPSEFSRLRTIEQLTETEIPKIQPAGYSITETSNNNSNSYRKNRNKFFNKKKSIHVRMNNTRETKST